MNININRDIDSLEYTQKKYKNIKSEKIDSSENSKKEIHNREAGHPIEPALKNQRILLKARLTLEGLEAVYSVIKEDISHNEKKANISNIIQTTRFQNELVLKDYRENLYESVVRNDISKVEEIIGQQKSIILNISRQETIKQNIIASTKKDIDTDTSRLMTRIIEDIRKHGIPELRIERTKILDLLG